MVDGFLEGGFDDGNPNTNPIGCLLGGAVAIVVFKGTFTRSESVTLSSRHILALLVLFFIFFLERVRLVNSI